MPEYRCNRCGVILGRAECFCEHDHPELFALRAMLMPEAYGPATEAAMAALQARWDAEHEADNA